MHYKSAIVLLLVATSFTACRQRNSNSQTPKGEFAFLLKLDGQLPADCGFFSNHIVQRRMANLMKADYQHFFTDSLCETPVHVNDEHYVYAVLIDCESHESKRVVAIDVASDAIVVAVKGDHTKTYEDAPSDILKHVPEWP